MDIYDEDAVPGGNGVALGEEDIVPVDGVELEGLGGRTVESSLVAQPDPRLDLLQHLHDHHQGSHLRRRRTSGGRVTASLKVRCKTGESRPRPSPVAAR